MHCHWLLSGSPVVGPIVFLDLYCGLLSVMQKKKKVKNYKEWSAKRMLLEKEMATHSSVLAWRIPGTGKPGGLRSMGSHRVRHD